MSERYMRVAFVAILLCILSVASVCSAKSESNQFSWNDYVSTGTVNFVTGRSANNPVALKVSYELVATGSIHLNAEYTNDKHTIDLLFKSDRGQVTPIYAYSYGVSTSQMVFMFDPNQLHDINHIVTSMEVLLPSKLLTGPKGEVLDMELALPIDTIDRMRTDAKKKSEGEIEINIKDAAASGNDILNILKTMISQPIYTRSINLQSADKDDDGKQGVLISFDYSRKQNVARLKTKPNSKALYSRYYEYEFKGSMPTNDTKGLDNINISLRLSTERGSTTNAAPTKSVIYEGYLKPDTTKDFDNVDYTAGFNTRLLLDIERVLHLPLSGASSNRSRLIPILGIGIESVKPEKRSTSPIPDMYWQATGFIDWNTNLPGNMDLQICGNFSYTTQMDEPLVKRWKKQVEYTLFLSDQGAGKRLPYLKYTTGKDSPLNLSIKELSLGMLLSL